MSFDSLTFARQLKAAGFTESQAEALADANRELLMPDLATKSDIVSVKGEIASARGEIALVKSEITSVRGEVALVKSEIASLRTDMATKGDMVSMEQRMKAEMEALSLRLTVRLGVMMATGIAILGAILHLH